MTTDANQSPHHIGMPAKRKDFTQIAFDVVQRATGEAIAPAPVKKAPAARKMPAKLLKATKPPTAG